MSGPDGLVALPKGRLLKGVLALLRETGRLVEFPRPRSLRSDPDRGGVTYLQVKPRVIPQLVHRRQVEAGFVGFDLCEDSGYDDLVTACDTAMNPVTVVAAVAEGRDDLILQPGERVLRIATEYTGLAARWARGQCVSHVVQQTHGSTEGYVPDLADVCVDCVETGDTLRENGLAVFEQILRSTTRLVTRQGCRPSDPVGAMIEDVRRACEARAMKGHEGPP